MNRLKIFGLVVGLASCAFGQPNILFITVDDMNADSLGVYGCPVKDTTPNLDALAGQGMRFEHAHVQAPNCTPSRNVFQTGRYPQNSGVEGFYDVEVDFPILPDLLKANGYYTGIWGKVADTTPRSNYDWDKVINTYGKGNAKNAEAIQKAALRFIRESQQGEKPFYLVMNISDPHHPLFGTKASQKKNYDLYPPSRIYTADEVEVPGFLPDIPGVREERHFYLRPRYAVPVRENQPIPSQHTYALVGSVAGYGQAGKRRCQAYDFGHRFYADDFGAVQH
jgi:N-sulfoglucosamine sulfohydrolase